MLDRKALLDKIEQMSIQEIHALLCDVLDESGIEYEIAPGTIPFYGLGECYSLEELHLSFARSGERSNATHRYVALNNGITQKLVFSENNYKKSTEWSSTMKYNAA